MNKNKKTITILIITIILLSLVICYLLFKLNKLNASDSNNQNKTTTKEILTSKKPDENLASCDINEDVECIYYNKNGFNVVRSPIFKEERSYFINDEFIGNFVEFIIEKIIDNKYLIVDNGTISTNNEIYDSNGNKIEFKCDLDVCSSGALMNYTNNKLTIRYYLTDDNVEDTICTYKPLDTIVYLKQEVEYSNGKFGTPKIIEKKTLKEFAKEAYDKNC